MSGKVIIMERGVAQLAGQVSGTLALGTQAGLGGGLFRCVADVTEFRKACEPETVGPIPINAQPERGNQTDGSEEVEQTKQGKTFELEAAFLTGQKDGHKK